ncbi:hypothetical protein F7Q91_03325 [Vibrio chagasii]|uniref:Uncharacterized protein n=1 Tax=Vibrio chagasii TaxID=170679 RepID=A0A7V7NX96_9VIBR|nr:hypothetical protein [Vibrio chagasii]KAB0482453.1 hypothetical protein F7Q91_03325 [Vibrio chagasii]
MNLKDLKSAFSQFTKLELSTSKKREQGYNELIQNIVAIRSSCIPPQVLSAFDTTPFNQLPTLLDRINADPLASSDLRLKISVTEKEQNRDLSKLNLVMVQDTIQSSKRWQNIREVAPANKPDTTITKKGKLSDGPSFER